MLKILLAILLIMPYPIILLVWLLWRLICNVVGTFFYLNAMLGEKILEMMWGFKV